MEVVSHRDGHTLLKIIYDGVLAGSYVYSDLNTTYNHIKRFILLVFLKP